MTEVWTYDKALECFGRNPGFWAEEVNDDAFQRLWSEKSGVVIETDGNFEWHPRKPNGEER